MATALESASLVMVPCGYEDGKLGSLQPTDGSGDFTFTRGSNLSATRVNAAGNIEKGYENLLLQSNSLGTTPWALNTTSATSGQIGYDGSSDAWLLSKSDAGGQIRQNVLQVVWPLLAFMQRLTPLTTLNLSAVRFINFLIYHLVL